MIHYHGLPITPETAALKAIEAGHAFVSFATPAQLQVAVVACQSFAVDNGAFSAWRAGTPIQDWCNYYRWVGEVRRYPGYDFAVVPDVIDGNECENDALLAEWPYPRHEAAAVWHLHESLDRLARLAAEWPRVALGSSGNYATIGSRAWWNRISEAMGIVCDTDGFAKTKLHGLRMLDPDVFSRLPFASADSTNIGRNVGIDSKWRGGYLPATKEARASLMRSRIESRNGAATWTGSVPEFEMMLF